MLPENQDASKNILIVTSGTGTADQFKQWFFNSGFHVDIASDAIQAVALVREYHYRLVLIDCQLEEDFAGLDVFWLMKPYVQIDHIVMMSHEIDNHRIQRVSSQGLHHLISKPFDPKRSPKEIEHALAEEEYPEKSRYSFLPFKELFHRIFSNN